MHTNEENEIRNKSKRKIRRKIQNGNAVLSFEFPSFEFVSDFGFRASVFSPSRISCSLWFFWQDFQVIYAACDSFSIFASRAACRAAVTCRPLSLI
ncbi:MAG TPA: hypothetical protein VFC78_20420, partial [Tepidisphaeraceae bacterium]|nr:hypothetical protein [Tepidisphaeraceae bacterium]